jgi:hypothetical protein
MVAIGVAFLLTDLDSFLVAQMRSTHQLTDMSTLQCSDQPRLTSNHSDCIFKLYCTISSPSILFVLASSTSTTTPYLIRPLRTSLNKYKSHYKPLINNIKPMIILEVFNQPQSSSIFIKQLRDMFDKSKYTFRSIYEPYKCL